MEELPPEVFLLILEKLDFNTLHKSCVLVSKTWFNFIRNYEKVSYRIAFTNTIPVNENLTRYMQKSWPVVSKLYANRNYSSISQLNVELLPNLSVINMKTFSYLWEENSGKPWVYVEKMNYSLKNAIEAIKMSKLCTKLEMKSNIAFKGLSHIFIPPSPLLLPLGFSAVTKKGKR